jgi:hypothetical protein
MKAPNKDVAGSLRGQRPGEPARGEETIMTQDLRGGGPTMIVPGEGSVAKPPGLGKEHGGERSAAKYAEPMAKFGGPGK